MAAYPLMLACVLSALVLRSMDFAVVATSLALWAAIYAALLLAVAHGWQQRDQL